MSDLLSGEKGENAMGRMPSDPKIVFTTDEGYKVFNSPDAGNQLTCSACANKNGCKHVRFAIKKLLDAESLWQHVAPGSGSIDSYLTIPIIPEYEVYENLVLKHQKDEDFASVYIPSPSEVFIGYFSQGDGRFSLRELVINHYENKVARVDRCRFPSHAISAQRVWTEKMKDSKTSFIEKLSVSRYGCCSYCRNENADRIIGEDDLIPEDDDPSPSGWDAKKYRSSRPR